MNTSVQQMGSYTAADEFNKYLMDDDIMVLWR